MQVRVRGGYQYKGHVGGSLIDMDEAEYNNLHHIFDKIAVEEPKKEETKEEIDDKKEPSSEMVEKAPKDRMMPSPSNDKRRRK